MQEKESLISRYGSKMVTIAILLLPYSYQYQVDNGDIYTRILAWLWEYHSVIKPEPFDDIIRFIPLPTTIVTLTPVLYLPTFYLVKVFHEFIEGHRASRDVYVWSSIAAFCPYLGYILPQFVGWPGLPFLSFPVGSLLSIFLTFYESRFYRNSHSEISLWRDTARNKTYP